MTKKKERQSNIELLRVVSMFIIVLYHFLAHALIPNYPQLDYITKPLAVILHIGVICFVLISGYWGIKFSLKGFMKLFLYCSFYALLIYVVGVIINPEMLNPKDLLMSFLPFQWWFIPIYLCLYLISPLVNIPIKRASGKTKIFFIIILAVISVGFGQFIPSLSAGKNPINFVLIYYLGNYLRTEIKWPSHFTLKKALAIYLGVNFIIFILIWGSITFFPALSKALFYLVYPYNSAVLIINAALFFIVFIHLKITSRAINWLASSTLSVYLIHENRYIGVYVYDFIKELYQTLGLSVLFVGAVVAIAIIVFVVAILMDKLLSPLFYRIIDLILSSKIITKANDRIQALLSGL